MLENQLMWPINIIDRPRLEIRGGTLAVKSDRGAARLLGATEVWRRASSGIERSERTKLIIE